MSNMSLLVVFGLASFVGAATWLLWCGFDTTYYLDADGNRQGPYRTWQVVGCGITYLALTAAGAYYFFSRAAPTHPCVCPRNGFRLLAHLDSPSRHLK
ncbi:hypothetical protein K0651_09850 [Ornithinimicrobium sp. Arc0846-15]|nr:hypothetical protein [Ornithinimicrobium laminariae]